jgi:hypothetical protein
MILTSIKFFSKTHFVKIYTMQRTVRNDPRHLQGVSEIRVLILASERTRQIMELFSITFLRKSNTN